MDYSKPKVTIDLDEYNDLKRVDEAPKIEGENLEREALICLINEMVNSSLNKDMVVDKIGHILSKDGLRILISTNLVNSADYRELNKNLIVKRITKG